MMHRFNIAEIPQTTFVQTYSGTFDYLNPKPEQVTLSDIAHALSNQPRYNGHTTHQYSVAQHCLCAAELASPQNKIHALLHDAGEAYTGDIPKPLKTILELDFLDDLYVPVIYKGLGLGEYPGIPDEVKKIDFQLLYWEKTHLFLDHVDWPCFHGVEMEMPFDHTPARLEPDVVETRFINTFLELTRG